MSIAGSATAIVGGRILNLVLTVAALPVLARILGPEQFGIYGASMAWLAVLIVLGEVGLFDGVRWMVARRGGSVAVALDEAGLASKLVLVPLCLVTLAATAAALMTGDLSRGQPLLLVSWVALLSSTYLDIARSALWGLAAEAAAELLLVVRSGLFLGLAVLVASSGMGGVGVFGAYTVATCVVAIACWVNLILRKRGAPGRVYESRSIPRNIPALLRFSLMAAVLSLGLTLLYQGDVVVLGFAADPRWTGQYRAAKSFAEILFFLPLGIQLLLMHHVAAAADDGAAAVRAIASRPSFVSGLLAGWGGAIALANAEALMTLLFGPQFGAASVQAQVLIPSVIALGVALPLLATLQGLGQLGPALALVLVLGGLTVVGTALAIRLLGPTSVAYVTAGAYFATATGLWIAARSRDAVVLSRKELGAIVVVFLTTLVGAGLLSGTGLMPLASVSVSAASGTVAAIAALVAIRFARGNAAG